MKRHGFVFALLMCVIGLSVNGTVSRAQDGPAIPGIDALPPLPPSTGKSDDYTHPSLRRTRQQQRPKTDVFDGEPNRLSVKQKYSEQTPTGQSAEEPRSNETRDPSWQRKRATPDRTDSNLSPSDRPFINREQDPKPQARNLQQNGPQSTRDLPSNRRNVYSGQANTNLSRSQADSVRDRAGANSDHRELYGDRLETPRGLNSLPNSADARSLPTRANTVPPKTGNSWFRRNAPSSKQESQGRYPAAKAKPKPATGTR